MQIFVKTLTNKILTLNVDSSTTVGKVKEKIYAKGLIPAEEQRLIFGGQQLSDSSKLSHYGIGGHYTIYLLLRLCGGSGKGGSTGGSSGRGSGGASGSSGSLKLAYGLNAKQAAKFIAKKFSLDDNKRNLLESIIGDCGDDPVLIVVPNDNWVGQLYNGQQNTAQDQMTVLDEIGTYDFGGNRRDKIAPHFAYHFRELQEVYACHTEILRLHPKAFAYSPDALVRMQSQGFNVGGPNPASTIPLAETIVVTKTLPTTSEIANYQFFHL